MAKKIGDLAVKTGEYERDGQVKGRYENVGSLMETDDGGQFLILKRTFSPAGVPNPEGRDSCLVSVFAPRDGDDLRGPAVDRGRRPEIGGADPARQGPTTLDDEIPF